jgi:hypothetical protein
MYFLTLPLIDREGKSQGRLSRWVAGGKDNYIPRIGEKIFIAPDTSVKIYSVSYDGPELQSIHVISEPVLDDLKDFLLQTLTLKKKNMWRWSA